MKGRCFMGVESLIRKMLQAADMVDEHSTEKIAGEKNGLRGMLQMDMMVSAFRVANDVPVSQEEADFINDCFEEKHPILYLETLRKKARALNVGYEVKTILPKLIEFNSYFSGVRSKCGHYKLIRSHISPSHISSISFFIKSL